ncbi:peptidyl-dipeptidase A [Melghirimyces profundicolus]|uniref:Peptidyl-dipeptidase A n=1 Tax=Melghirimyces profundicolus TaxID=1242148 RepID=A0A2T6BTC6_9BACL|nr:M2 family metallopeptidase [Melghirimyces profundicolus]PTX59340.1 peptidyl-dipeptidase A [Melghirimyces profundicolus]
MENGARSFLQETLPAIREMEQKLAETHWKASTTGNREFEAEYARLLKEKREFLADAERLKRLEEIRKEPPEDPLLARQLDLLYREFAACRMEPDEIEKLVEMETEIESTFVHFRADYGGKKVSDNELKNLLRTEWDPYKRKAAWKAGKQVGEVVAGNIRELAKLRNRIARKSGYPNFYDMLLQFNEIDQGELFRVLERLKEETDLPFSQVKAELDKAVARPYDFLRPEGVRPWHYTDPFFQHADPIFGVDTDEWLREWKLEELANRTFREMGLETEEVLRRSDLYEREGKSRHAFCLDIDREGDTRILCNLRPDASGLETLLHELGHAVYDQYHDPDLPWLLRQPAHIAATEAIAMLTGRMTKVPAWWERVVGVSSDELDKMRGELEKQAVLDRLVFIRWSLVMVYFERDLYADPDRDLDTLWWDYVEQFQFVPRPEGRKAPDWAAEIHLGTAPVHYQNDLLGELIASQILEAMKKTFPGAEHPLVNNPEAGEYLKKRIFQPGARESWQSILEKATGEKLNPGPFLRHCVLEVKEEKRPGKPSRPAKK